MATIENKLSIERKHIIIDNKTARNIFKGYFGSSKNFITNNIVGYYRKRKQDYILAFELSSGRFIENYLYGVTILIYDLLRQDIIRINGINKSFTREEQARNFISDIKSYSIEQIKELIQ